MVTGAKWTALVLGLAVSSAACSSPVTSPSTIITTSWLLTTPRILAFGDSLTEGANGDTVFPPVDPATAGLPHSYPYKLRALLADRYRSQTISIFNGGVGGSTAANARPRLAMLMSQFNPDVVILLYGVNDLNNGATVEATALAMMALVNDVHARGRSVIVSTLTRQRPGGLRAFSPALVIPYNFALQQLASASGSALADIYPLVSEALLAPDGLHLTETANFVLASTYFDILLNRFEVAK